MHIKTFLEYLERNRSRAAIGFLILFLISAGLMYFVLTGKTRAPETKPAEAAITLPEASDTRVRRLDGVSVPVGEEAHAPFGVMIENHPDARPLSGLSKAQVVIEAPVEGGITRFLALFDPSTNVEEIGPVRSARPYYVDWADSWHAAYAHVGGSPEALTLLKSKPYVTDLDQFRYGNSYWRSILRFAPHNVYTNMEMLNALAKDLELTNVEMPSAWKFETKPELAETGDKTDIRILYGGSFNVLWKYDKDTDTYVRYENGAVQKDKDGSVVTAKNVVAVKTDTEVVDEEGRLHLRTTGSGEAIGFRNGNEFAIRWSRSGGNIIKFETVDGDYALEPGTVWLEVVADQTVEASNGSSN